MYYAYLNCRNSKVINSPGAFLFSPSLTQPVIRSHWAFVSSPRDIPCLASVIMKMHSRVQRNRQRLSMVSISFSIVEDWLVWYSSPLPGLSNRFSDARSHIPFLEAFQALKYRQLGFSNMSTNLWYYEKILQEKRQMGF